MARAVWDAIGREEIGLPVVYGDAKKRDIRLIGTVAPDDSVRFGGRYMCRRR